MLPGLGELRIAGDRCLTGTLHPDGFFTIGAIPPKKVKRCDRDYEREHDNQYIEVERIEQDPYWYGDARETRVIQETYFVGYSPRYLEKLYERLKGQTVGLSNVHNSDPSRDRMNDSKPTHKKQQGLKGITSLGRRRIIDGCTLLEESYTIKRLGFGTLTLPSLSSDALAIINRLWAKVIEAFHRRLRKLYKKLGVPEYLLGVTEVQTGRLKKYGQFALHYHFVYVACDKKGGFYFTADWVRKAWQEILIKVLKDNGIDEDVTTSAAVDLQKVKKSAKHYLSKYVSKGKQQAEALADEGYSEQIPAQWWAMTKRMRDRIKGALVRISQDICELILDSKEQLIELGMIRKCVASASYKCGDMEVICGYWGVMSLYGIEQLLDVF